MGIFDILLRRSRVIRTRRHYDKLRERVDKFPRIEKRIEMLKMMDQLEPHIISMEEHPMSKFEQKRTAGFIEAGLRRIKYMMKEESYKNK
jgi:hypothetical protein